MNVAKYILLFVVLSFALTTTASAAMACCWNISQSETMTDAPCHNPEDTDKSDTANNCCDDMALCKVSPIHNSVSVTPDTVATDNNTTPTFLEWAFTYDNGPPTPPPKQFL